MSDLWTGVSGHLVTISVRIGTEFYIMYGVQLGSGGTSSLLRKLYLESSPRVKK